MLDCIDRMGGVAYCVCKCACGSDHMECWWKRSHGFQCVGACYRVRAVAWNERWAPSRLSPLDVRAIARQCLVALADRASFQQCGESGCRSPLCRVHAGEFISTALVAVRTPRGCALVNSATSLRDLWRDTDGGMSRLCVERTARAFSTARLVRCVSRRSSQHAWACGCIVLAARVCSRRLHLCLARRERSCTRPPSAPLRWKPRGS